MRLRQANVSSAWVPACAGSRFCQWQNDGFVVDGLKAVIPAQAGIHTPLDKWRSFTTNHETKKNPAISSGVFFL
jgi:hypothetical protein